MKRIFIALAVIFPASLAQADEQLLGAAVRSRPHYDGSERRTTDLVPVVRYFHGPWFARTTHGILEGGARYAAGGLAAGVQVAHEAGPLDGDAGASLGAHAEWTTRLGPAPVNALARARSQTDSERGRLFDARLTVGVYGSHGLRAGLFGQATWASEKHMLAYYDARDSGLLYTSAGLMGSYEFGRRWLAVGSAELRRLADAPARSAFVQDRTNTYVMAGVAYRFRP
jgi:outer membrane scaffolding protein for murein synthesis (MipA/OmpV family)